ncbi:MAG TPA: GAF domain-containing protein [Rhizomicrobium sp.]|nr:GAF domain-containing protein [Rhizomicrobium sp.]
MLTVDAIRRCLDGEIPASIATCSPGGVPNITLLSQVQYVDGCHVALSYQFFNKTRENILANPFALVEVIDPVSAAVYQLSLQYLRTQTCGPLFENMKAKLAGIASHEGMTNIFRLLGADIYRVLSVQAICGTTLPEPPGRNLLAATRLTCEHLMAGADMTAVLDRLTEDLAQLFGVTHAMVLMHDEAAARLYTVASLGYDASGVGSEIPLGQGVIGVAARERIPIRISHFASDYVYSRAMRESIGADGMAGAIESRIPLPGLAEPHSQLAVPILAQGRLLGVLFSESAQDRRFGYDEEDALATIAAQLGVMLLTLQTAAGEDGAGERLPAPPPTGATATIRRYGADNSIFIDDDYLIKGVAGAIFWKLLRDYAGGRRGDFTNKELRLEPALKLPALSENLEARLILLERRLAERTSFMRIEKTGRGRFRLAVRRPVQLMEMPDGGSH